MKIPRDFSDLLTPRGRRVLEGRDREWVSALAVPGATFIASTALIDRSKAAALRDELERALLQHLVPLEAPIPFETISELQENYRELLPKTVRVRTAMLERRRAKSSQVAEAMGLTALLQSESFGEFAAAVSGRRLRRRWGTQVLCYGPGDYAGPHHDHHPEDDEAREGYTDVHLSLSTPAVAQQLLVYAREGHFSGLTSVNTVGGVTAYRLPFWHYTTPLVARRGKEAAARRWVLLGTFIDASPGARRGAAVDPPALRLR